MMPKEEEAEGMFLHCSCNEQDILGPTLPSSVSDWGVWREEVGTCGPAPCPPFLRELYCSKREVLLVSHRGPAWVR